MKTDIFYENLNFETLYFFRSISQITSLQSQPAQQISNCIPLGSTCDRLSVDIDFLSLWLKQTWTKYFIFPDFQQNNEHSGICGQANHHYRYDR